MLCVLVFHILNISCCKDIVPNKLKHLTLFVEIKKIYFSLVLSFVYIFLDILLEYLKTSFFIWYAKKTCLNTFFNTLNHHYYCYSYCYFHHYYHCCNYYFFTTFLLLSEELSSKDLLRQARKPRATLTESSNLTA